MNIEEEIKQNNNINNIENKEKVKTQNPKNNKNEITLKTQQNDNFRENEEALINSMSLEMTRLKENLTQSNAKINELIQENNKLKLLQLENTKKASVKDNIINSNKIEINRLQTKNKDLDADIEEKKKIIQDLNYKIIELNQKIESNESLNRISQKIKNVEKKNGDNDLLVKISELYNKINEIEIKNSKLIFDNKNLLTKIELQKNEKKNEIEIIEILHKKQIENLEKNINSLNNTINELINEKKKEPKELNYLQIQTEVYKNFSELEQKLRKNENDNFTLKKENQKLINDNEELKIIINGKENIINKLQHNISRIENEFKIKLTEISSNNKSPNINIDNNNNNEINDINNQIINENLEKMVEDQKRLNEENIILKNNYEQMTQGINQANELFVNKQKEYENIINYQNEKLKEYKFKISLLKIKINELHSEIEFLQDKQIKNQNNFYQSMSDKILSNIDKEQQSLDLNFTPEQIKLINNYNNINSNQKANINYNIDNMNEK